MVGTMLQMMHQRRQQAILMDLRIHIISHTPILIPCLTLIPTAAMMVKEEELLLLHCHHVIGFTHLWTETGKDSMTASFQEMTILGVMMLKIHCVT
jgi:hypothetical protein